MPHLTKDELTPFLPHAGAMRLIDRVESWDESTIRCHAGSHRDPANPLRDGSRLNAVTGLEYAAQAIGLHVGLRNQTRSEAGSIGYIGSLRNVVFRIDRLDECREELIIDAMRLFEDEYRFVYQFTISCGNRELLKGRASMFLREAHT
jgi:predicted hotdog family 3-hydroxylacyl-ACP dehydratase